LNRFDDVTMRIVADIRGRLENHAAILLIRRNTGSVIFTKLSTVLAQRPAENRSGRHPCKIFIHTIVKFDRIEVSHP